jgi:uncharacterized protein (DUF1697 family)
MQYVAFLRAVNVGGRVVKMDELKSYFAMPGISAISSYIQSGNILFECKETDKEKLRDKIETKLLKALQYEVKTFVLDAEDMDRIEEDNPYKDMNSEEQLYVSLLSNVPDKKLFEAIVTLQSPEEQFSLIGSTLYMKVKKGTYGNSVFSNTFFEKKLHVRATTRNQNTMKKVRALMG